MDCIRAAPYLRPKAGRTSRGPGTKLEDYHLIGRMAIEELDIAIIGLRAAGLGSEVAFLSLFTTALLGGRSAPNLVKIALHELFVFQRNLIPVNLAACFRMSRVALRKRRL
jgi:hypothetical protein